MKEHPRISKRQKTLFTICVTSIVLAALILSGLFLKPVTINPIGQLLPPNFQSPFGTDWLGRDMLTRTLKGLTLSFAVGLIAAFLSACIALLLSLSASINRHLDAIVGWLIDLFLSVPHLVTLILIAFVLGGGLKGVIIGIALTHWPKLTRVLRAEILQVQTAEYVQISNRLGKTRRWIARHHYVPHILPQLFVGFILLFPHAILHEAAITFLGFGLSPEQPAIGIILSEAMRYLVTGKWWLAFFPGIALVFMVWLFDMLGNSIKLLWNPFERGGTE